MAAITGVYAVHGTLAANTAQTVVLTGAREVVTTTNRTGTTGIYFTVADSGVTPPVPTVGGNDCYVAPETAGASKTVPAGQPPVEVTLIASATQNYSVEGGLATLVIER